jgi:hypothetical protein
MASMLTTVDMAIRAAFTLDDIAAMAAADARHRYELLAGPVVDLT